MKLDIALNVTYRLLAKCLKTTVKVGINIYVLAYVCNSVFRRYTCTHIFVIHNTGLNHLRFRVHLRNHAHNYAFSSKNLLIFSIHNLCIYNSNYMRSKNQTFFTFYLRTTPCCCIPNNTKNAYILTTIRSYPEMFPVV